MDCALCHLALPQHPIVDTGNAFCCHGCHAVYQILLSKSALDHYQTHPVFEEAVRAGLISNPLLLDELRKKKHAENKGGEVEKLFLEIGDMWCPSCAEFIQLVLMQEKGVLSCLVDYSTDLAAIEYSPLILSKEGIKKRIHAMGYMPLALDAPERQTVSYTLYLRCILAAFCAANTMMFAYPIYASYFEFDGEGYGVLFSWFSFVASIPVATYCAWPIYKRAWSAALVGIIGMEALVTIGVLSAFLLSSIDLFNGGTQVYFDSMTVVVVFVLLGKIIETKAKFSAKSSLIRLHKGVPKRGRKQAADGGWRFVPVKDISPGERVQVVTGEKIVLDGVVVKGGGACDESLMTGESMPVIKGVGDRVLAGSILQQGVLEFEAVSTQEETALHRILQMVEADIGHKSAYVRAVDPWVKTFVPAVLVFAALVFFVWLPTGRETAFSRMMAVLLISCPCAIGVAVPLVESHLMQALTNLGVVIRNRRALRFLGCETAFVFDKTGTITTGSFQVLSGLEALADKEKCILKSLTAHSTHPISRAITQAIEASPIILDEIEELAGKGIRATCQGTAYYLGSRSLLNSFDVSMQEGSSQATTVFFGRGRSILTAVALGDQLKGDAAKTVNELSFAKKILLSGDSRGAVESAAQACGFTEWYYEASPLQKREVVEELKKKGEIVCVLGDGINDAPALTSAHIGVSVLSAADISVQVSDILMTTDRLDVLPIICRLARQSHRIIKQNLFWAFFYNVIGIALAAFGWLSPVFAAGAMVISSLIVLFNSKRVSRGVYRT